jgi:hypothetical protein
VTTVTNNKREEKIELGYNVVKTQQEAHRNEAPSTQNGWISTFPGLTVSLAGLCRTET